MKYPNVKTLTFTGGVACNKFFRQKLKNWCTENNKNFVLTDPQFCTDNAAMIALIGFIKATNNHFSSLDVDVSG
jgi:N6-L-threonylcarbamoyladenine synthase